MKATKPTILLVNPWIHDFAAYDFWMKPLGLLYIGSLLRKAGVNISLLDCLYHPALSANLRATLKSPPLGTFGRGHFYKEIIPKPDPLRQIPRHYRRYGIPPAILQKYLVTLPKPQLILMTSFMTYWYPGIQESIIFLRKNMPGVPIILGGIYPTLCPEHAFQNAGADHVLVGPWDKEKWQILFSYLNNLPDFIPPHFSSWPFPAFDLYPHLAYVCLLTRQGCPFSCTYCASSLLSPAIMTRDPDIIIKEIKYWHKKLGITDFAFYDDALLYQAEDHIKPILKQILKEKIKVNFHTPNALHVRELDEELAFLLKSTGFKTIRLGLESALPTWQMATGRKVSNLDFQRALSYLQKAGYVTEEIGVYLLAGLPGQRAEEVEESIAFVRGCGAKPILAEYSPIPGTPLFAQSLKFSPFDLKNEPLYQNNSIFPCQWSGFTWDDLKRLKVKIKT